jgi:hypothetical protein
VPDPFEYVNRMISGQVPTTLTFRCLACGGIGLVYAGRWIGDELRLSISCYGCGRLREEDGVPTWPGWEAILVERFSDELQQFRAGEWKSLVATGEFHLDQGTLRFHRTTNAAAANWQP